MTSFNDRIFTVLLSALLLLAAAGSAEAQRGNDRDIRDAIRSLNSRIDDLDADLREYMRSNSEANADVTLATDSIRGLRDSVWSFEQNFDRRREGRADVSGIVGAARPVGNLLARLQTDRRIDDDWTAVKEQIDRLSANYGIVTNWNAETVPEPVRDYPVYPAGKTLSVGLSGTYEIDRARSEKVDDIVADTRLGDDQRQDLRDKLEAPEQIAIDIRGSEITLATSNAPAVKFIADGRDKVERDAQGRSVRLRATLSADKLIVSSIGGETDYNITFTSVSEGRTMKVSRRITTDYLNQTVFAESVYNKIDSVAQLSVGGNGRNSSGQYGGYSDNDRSGNVSNGGVPTVSTTRSGNFVVPNGVILTGSLDNEVNTKVSQNNDRFSMTVQSPSEFRGARVEGYISGINRSGKVLGQSKITFNFERITLRDGQTYDFAAVLQGIQDQNGKAVKVDNEGTAKGDSQTKETAKRGGIGAGIGAVLGAIIGGGKGAAIGAVIGAGGGAGSVILTGKEDIRLMAGSTLTVMSTSSSNVGPR